MSKSNLYRVHPESKILQSVREIDFSDFGFKERFDIQEWIESTPEVLGEELLIIAKEKSYFEGTRERPDLIALDKMGNVVVIELKRDDSGVNTEWQAIKYASYWSKFKVDNIIEVYADHLKRKAEISSESEEDVASQKIIEFVNDGTLDNINVKQRIILVSHRYAKEVISAVNWLIDSYRTDIKCIQLIPYYDSDKEAHYIQSNEILPVIGVEGIIVSASGHPDTLTGPVRKDDKVTHFFENLREELFDRLDRDLRPDKYSRWAGVGTDYRYYHFWYSSEIWDNWGNSYKIWLFDKNHSDKELRGKFVIYLDMSKKHLLTRGFTEEHVYKIQTFLENIALEGFKFEKDDDNIWLESHVVNEELSEKTKTALLDKLETLIRATKEYISKLSK
ncbi:MAG: hypothetical protein MUO97_06975 [Dehalococcoidia bacterium]|nr:hypothetical protein [Dehalococcoidia bacterium]